MNKYILLILFSCILCSKNSFSQKLSGCIYSKETKRPIEYCTITNTDKSLGINSDSKGCFLINNISKSNNYFISALGYKPVILTINEDSNQVIYLEEDTIQLNEVNVYRNKSVSIGSMNRHSKGSFGGWFDSNYELAVLMPNHRVASGTIKEVAFYIVKDGVFNTPFRVRFYANRNNQVGEEITQQNIILKAYKAQRWNKFNVSQYNLKFPEEGCFAVLEWLNVTSEKYKYMLDKDKHDKNIKIGFGQVVGMTTEQNVLNCFYRENQKGWHEANSIFQIQTSSFELPKLYGPMIRVTVQY